ncbi:uncharacterized protein LOC141580503 [Saimiri boliviensis]|uniref:uncharacterized protein LOC141580503 n=1 Tax=Saimiri boliviensis TaxID=27679 RepID=UPI003D77EE15
MQPSRKFSETEVRNHQTTEQRPRRTTGEAAPGARGPGPFLRDSGAGLSLLPLDPRPKLTLFYPVPRHSDSISVPGEAFSHSASPNSACNPRVGDKRGAGGGKRRGEPWVSGGAVPAQRAPRPAELAGPGWAAPGSVLRAPGCVRSFARALPASPLRPPLPARTALWTHPDPGERILQPQARSGWARRAAGAKRSPAWPPPSACSGPGPDAPRSGRAIFASSERTRRAQAFLPARGPPPSSLLRRARQADSNLCSRRRRRRRRRRLSLGGEGATRERGLGGWAGVRGPRTAHSHWEGARPRRAHPTPGAGPAPPRTRKEPSSRRKRPKDPRSPAPRCREEGPAAGKGAPDCWWCSGGASLLRAGPLAPPHEPAPPPPPGPGPADAVERTRRNATEGSTDARPSAPATLAPAIRARDPRSCGLLRVDSDRHSHCSERQSAGVK